MFVVVCNLQVLQVPVMPPSITSELCDIIQIEYKLKVHTTAALIIPTNAILEFPQLLRQNHIRSKGLIMPGEFKNNAFWYILQHVLFVCNPH